MATKKQKIKYLELKKNGYTFKIKPIGNKGACFLIIQKDEYAGCFREVYKSIGDAQRRVTEYLENQKQGYKNE